MRLCHGPEDASRSFARLESIQAVRRRCDRLATYGARVSTALGKETIMLGTSMCRLKDSLVAAIPSLRSASSRWSAWYA